MDEKLPESLDWYRDTFKWFVALASGLLAFIVTFAKDHPSDDLWVKLAVCALFLLFGVAGAISAWACVWVVDYANRWENAQACLARDENIDQENAALASILKKLRLLYNSALWLFFSALIFTALLFSILTLTEEPSKPCKDALVVCRQEKGAGPVSTGKTMLLYLTDIGPFPPGSASLNEGCVFHSDLKARIEELTPRLNYLLLIGSADEQRMRRNGSNRKLAIARAFWVEDCLRRSVPPGNFKTVRSINGPINLNTRDSQLLAEDRIVQIYAEVQVK